MGTGASTPTGDRFPLRLTDLRRLIIAPRGGNPQKVASYAGSVCAVPSGFGGGGRSTFRHRAAIMIYVVNKELPRETPAAGLTRKSPDESFVRETR